MLEECLSWCMFCFAFCNGEALPVPDNKSLYRLSKSWCCKVPHWRCSIPKRGKSLPKGMRSKNLQDSNSEEKSHMCVRIHMFKQAAATVFQYFLLNIYQSERIARVRELPFIYMRIATYLPKSLMVAHVLFLKCHSLSFLPLSGHLHCLQSPLI